MTELELIVLGSSAAAPAAGDACSGYLVRHGHTRVLLDCGSGTLSRLLQQGESLATLSAIVVSHFHPDHYLDLVTMRYALRYGAPQPNRPLLLVPPGGTEFLAGLGEALRRKCDFFADSFRIEEYATGRTRLVGDLRLTFCRTTHDEPTWAVSLAAPQGARLVYSGDTRPSADLEAFARDASVLLCESTYPVHAGDVAADNHLTSAEAGDIGRRAGVGRLVLTHFWPAFPRERFASEAEATFGAPVTLATSGLRVPVHA